MEARFDGKVPLTATLIGMDRPDHTRLRRVVNAAFTPRVVARKEDAIRATVVDLIEALPSNTPFDLLKDFSYPLALTVISVGRNSPGGHSDLSRPFGAVEELSARRPDLSLVSEPGHVPHFIFRGLSELTVAG